MAKTGEVTQQAVTRSELDLSERGISRSMSGRRGMLRRCEDVVDVLLEHVSCLKNKPLVRGACWCATSQRS